MEMASLVDTAIREQLVDRRRKLEVAIAQSKETAYLPQLLQEVDAALNRINNGSYGLCETCHDPIETDRLMADPLVRFCLASFGAEHHSLPSTALISAYVEDLRHFRSAAPKIDDVTIMGIKRVG
jgi:RNA polymerase-binding transcription factor DksA